MPVPLSFSSPPRLVLFCLLSAVALAATGLRAHAQSSQDVVLPDDPSILLQSQNTGGTPQTTSTAQREANPDKGPQQTKRILGIVPNFRAVSANQKLPPQTAREKFTSTFQQSFDYSSFVFVAILAGVNEADSNSPEFHGGAAGYARYYWHDFADQTGENFFVQAIYPSIFHQDSRYYTLGHGGVLKRAGYAFSRIFITRTDRDTEQFNVSEILGAGSASAVSDLYYPSQERTWTKTGQRWLLDVGIDGGVFMFQEFWPNINAKLFHQKS